MRILTFLAFSLINLGSFAQEANVFIDLGIKKYNGKINELDRERYFGLHTSFMNNDLADEAPYLVNDLNTHFAIDTQGPELAGKLNGLSASQLNLSAKDFASSRTKNLAFDNESWLLTQDAKKVYLPNLDYEKSASQVAKYLKNAYPILPAYYDIFSEPLSLAKTAEEIRDIAFFHKKMTSTLKKELKTVKIGGFSERRPHFEQDNFDAWTNTFELFLDNLGDELDYISIKMFDEITEKQSLDYCSGSNLEATLDLLETYCFNKWEDSKPFLISAFGLDTEPWEGTDYVEGRDTYIIESLNKILVALLDKPDRLEKAIPYVLGSNTAFYQNKKLNPGKFPHPLSIMRKQEDSSFTFTHLQKFYEFWRDVEGQRTYISSDNPDIQVNAFVKNGKWYLIFNNLSDESQLINFNFSPVDIDVITKYTLRRLFMNEKGNPELTEAFTDLHIDQLDIDPNETFMLICDVPKDIAFATSIVEYNNYSTEYLVDIKADEPLLFKVPNVKIGKGKAYIRLSMGRELGKDLNPIVHFNDNIVLTPKNWAGDDQKGRESFFGTLNIAVPMSYVQKYNSISVKFSDSGGKVSSVVLNTEIFSDDVENQNYIETNALVYASHGGNLLNVSDKIACKTPKITDLKGNVIKRLKFISNGETVDISTLKSGEYYLETTTDGKIKFKK